MSKPRIIEATIDQLTPDLDNANRGTQRGTAFLEHSVQQRGAARSGVLDKNNKIVAGNQATQAFANAGMEKVLIIEVDGNTPVYVKRTDFDLDDPEGPARQYAFEDNRASELSLNMDAAVLARQSEAGLDLTRGFNDTELQRLFADANAQVVNDTSFLNDFLTPPATGNSATEQAANGSNEPPSDSAGSANDTESGHTASSEAQTDSGSTASDTTPDPQTHAKLLFLLPEATRDAITKRLNEIKKAQSLPTLAHALCKALEIPYEG